MKRRAKRAKRAERKKKRKGGIPYYIYKEGGGDYGVDGVDGDLWEFVAILFIFIRVER